MSITGTPGYANRQSEDARAGAVRLVEKTVTAELALRSALANVFVSYLRGLPKPNCSKVQIVPISTDNDRVWAQSFNPIDTVGNCQLIDLSIGPSNCIQVWFGFVLRSSPPTAGAVKQVIADEAVLKSIARRFRQAVIIPGWRGVAAVVKAREWHA